MDGRLVKATEDADARVLLAVESCADARYVEEQVVVIGLGSGHELIEKLTLKVAEVYHVQLAGSPGSQIVAGDLSGSGAGLLVDPGDNSVGGATASVVLLLAITINRRDFLTRTKTG